MDLYNHRHAKETSDRLDHARDSDVDIRDRFFHDTTRLTPEAHLQRASESIKRLETDIRTAVDKNQWPRVQADLRHQLGTLRYDLQMLINNKTDKAAREEGDKLQNKVFDALSELDLYARKGDARAADSLQTAVGALNDVMSFLG
jgi:hypothetical protein